MAGADPKRPESPAEQLAWAIQSGEAREALRLLQAGADPNATGGVFNEPLLLPAARKENADLVRAMIEAGADVNARSRIGETALMTAVRFGYEDSIRYLLSKGANAALKNDEGQTAASLAEKILEQNHMNMMSQALDGVLRANEQQLVDKWHTLAELLKQAEKDALSVALKNNLPVGKPLTLKRFGGRHG